MNAKTGICPQCGALMTPKAKVCVTCYKKKMRIRNQLTAPERMRRNNPMNNPETREKMSQTLKRIGHKPPIHGGNGTGATQAQELLAKALGEGWLMEYPVKTHAGRINDMHYPTCYKVDIANAQKKIAIEVDGASHLSLLAQARDKKKENFLKSQGWKVLRFKNAEVLETLSNVLKTITSIT